MLIDSIDKTSCDCAGAIGLELEPYSHPTVWKKKKKYPHEIYNKIIEYLTNLLEK